MVSPLQTWQYSEPKYLWPILGGLAVMTHVGVLGLSLPYVLSLMTPSGETQSVVPVELVVVNPADESTGPPTVSANSAGLETPLSESSIPNDSNSDSTLAKELPAKTQKYSDDSVARLRQNSEPSPPQAQQASSNRASDSPTADPVEADPPAADPLTAEPSTSHDSSAQPPIEGQNGSDEDPLPVVEGQPITPPNFGDNSSTVQAVALQVTGTQVNWVTDLKDTAPQLIDGSDPIALEPDAVGCGKVDFPQEALTYRVDVGADGSLLTLTRLGSDTISGPDDAIACLIRAANFTFAPATHEGEPVADNGLLITIGIIEMKDDRSNG
ncbi:MAG: hypothetical protein HC800_05665 [Phormidesmis sp. RL_2_1]|nr:hypothetical protein [Phormidesmis sp. RL_2_1]